MTGRALLFVGRLPIDIRERDVEEVFEKYGRLIRCDVKCGTRRAYAFLEYNDRQDAEDAIKYENGREIRGQSIIVEWSHGSRSRRENYGRSSRQSGEECFCCRRTGHWAKNCPEQERDRYYPRSTRCSRSRSHSYQQRTVSRMPVECKKKDILETDGSDIGIHFTCAPHLFYTGLFQFKDCTGLSDFKENDSDDKKRYGRDMKNKEFVDISLTLSDEDSSDKSSYDDIPMEDASSNLKKAPEQTENNYIVDVGSSPIGTWEKHTKGIGSKLMMKMGYVWGQGLGKHSNGRLKPVEAFFSPKAARGKGGARASFQT